MRARWVGVGGLCGRTMHQPAMPPRLAVAKDTPVVSVRGGLDEVLVMLQGGGAERG